MKKEQGRGYGQAALALLLAQCRREGKYPRVEVCVKKMDEAAIHIYEKAGFRDTGYTDPDAPDSLCMAWDLPEVWRGKVELRLTGIQDLEQVRRLWATPSVMHYVGFPEGLHETMDHLRNEWLPWVQQPPKRQRHWSVYAEGVGYCGETYYHVDETGLACMDIKLLDCARGRALDIWPCLKLWTRPSGLEERPGRMWIPIRRIGRLWLFTPPWGSSRLCAPVIWSHGTAPTSS